MRVRVSVVFGLFALCATSLQVAAQNSTPLPPKRVYLVSLRPAQEGANDLANFATRLLELRLAEVPQVILAGSSPPPCAVNGSPEAPEFPEERNSKFFVVSGSLSRDPQNQSTYSLGYLVREFDSCQPHDPPLIPLTTESLDTKNTLTVLSRVFDDIASRLSEAASDKKHVRVEADDPDLQSYIELALNRSPLFRVAGEESKPDYIVRLERQSVSKAKSKLWLTISGPGAPTGRQEIPQIRAEARQQFRAYSDTANYVLKQAAQSYARNMVGTDGDPLAKAETAGCTATPCTPNPYVVITLLADRVSEMPPEASKLLGDAYARTGDAEHAAHVYDEALNRNPPAEVRSHLLDKSADAWLQAGDAAAAFKRLKELSDLQNSTGKGSAELAIKLAHAATAAQQPIDARAALVNARSAFPSADGISAEWEELVNSLQRPVLKETCSYSQDRLKDDRLTGMCLHALARTELQTPAQKAQGVSDLKSAIAIFEKDPRGKQWLADAEFDYAQNVNRSDPKERAEARAKAEDARKIRIELNENDGLAESYQQLGELLTWDYDDKYAYEEAEKNYRKALELRNEKETKELASLKAELAYAIAQQRPHDTEIKQLYTSAISIYSELGDRWSAADICSTYAGFLSDFLGDYAGSESYYRRALQILADLNALEYYRAALVMGRLVPVLSNEGKFEEGIAMGRRSIAVEEKIFGSRASETASGHLNLSAAYLYLGKYQDAYTEDLKAKDLANPKTSQAMVARFDLAIADEYLGHYAEAVHEYDAAVELSPKIGAAHSREAVYEKMRYANTLTALGRYTEAQQLLDQVRPEMKRWYPEPAQIVRTIELGSEADLLTALGHYGEALPKAKEALDMREKNRNPSESEWRLCTYLLRVGHILTEMGRHTEAAAYYNRVIKTWTDLKVHDHPDLTIAYLELGLGSGATGDFDAMQRNCGQALSLALANPSVGRDHPTTARAYACLADYYDRAKVDLQQAVNNQKEAVGIFSNLYASRAHPELAHALERYGDLLDKAGEHTAANDQRAKAATLLKKHAAMEQSVQIASSLH